MSEQRVTAESARTPKVCTCWRLNRDGSHGASCSLAPPTEPKTETTQRSRNGRPLRTHKRSCSEELHGEHTGMGATCADCGCCWGCDNDCCAETFCPDPECGCSRAMRTPSGVEIPRHGMSNHNVRRFTAEGPVLAPCFCRANSQHDLGQELPGPSGPAVDQ